jgi:hypothetical protein
MIGLENEVNIKRSANSNETALSNDSSIPAASPTCQVTKAMGNKYKADNANSVPVKYLI